MKELMIAVERVVRPVRAEPRRKMKMRQELLAHLTSAYEEGRARLGNDGAALEEAVRRFGNPTDLTRDLQASVPYYEGVLFVHSTPGAKWMAAFDRYMEGKQGEFPSRRMVCWTLLWFLSSFVLFAGTILIYQSMCAGAAGVVMVTECYAVLAGLIGVFMVCVHVTYRQLSGSLRLAGVLRAMAFAALAVGTQAVAFGAMLHWMLDIPIPYDRAAVGVFVGFLLVLGVSFAVRYQEAAKRGSEEWTRLEIAD